MWVVFLLFFFFVFLNTSEQQKERRKGGETEKQRDRERQGLSTCVCCVLVCYIVYCKNFSVSPRFLLYHKL